MHVCIHVCIYVIFKLGFERYGGNCPSWEGNCPGELSGGSVRGGIVQGGNVQAPSSTGRSFQADGPTTEKALRCIMCQRGQELTPRSRTKHPTRCQNNILQNKIYY